MRPEVHRVFKSTRGLVLREVRYKEADRILTILTEEDGKISARARGALRSKSKVAAATQLLTFSELTLFGNKGKWSINEASPVEQFLGLRGDIERLALGSYFAEVLEAVSDEDCPNPEVLRLGLNSLFALSGEVCPMEQVKAVFELRLMCLSGYEPDLSVCHGCGAQDMESAYLWPESGELYCEKCARPGMLPVGGAALRAMRHIIGAESKRIFSFTLDDDGLAELVKVCESYALYELDRPFGSLDYYKKLRKFK